MRKEDLDARTRDWYEGLRHGLLYGYEDNMKVTQDATFKPVVITIETRDELLDLRRFLLNAEHLKVEMPNTVKQLLGAILMASTI